MPILDLDNLIPPEGMAKRGLSLFEATEPFVGEPLGNRPAGESPALVAMLEMLYGQVAFEEQQQQIKSFIPLLANSTHTKQTDQRRAWMAGDWSVREYAPRWLEQVGFAAEAKGLRGLNPISTPSTARSAVKALLEVKPVVEETCRNSGAYYVRFSAKDAFAYTASEDLFLAIEGLLCEVRIQRMVLYAHRLAGLTAWLAGRMVVIRSREDVHFREVFRSTDQQVWQQGLGLVERLIKYGADP